jgi:hypothetical protein
MSEAVPRASADNVYDVIVIGAGPVGLNVADRSRAGGLSVAVVERELVGGECAYWGCVPSKALLRPVIAVADARRVGGAREAITGPLDRPSVFSRRNRYVSDWDDSGEVAKHVTGIGADLVRGHGRLDGPRRVAVITPDDRLVVLAGLPAAQLKQFLDRTGSQWRAGVFHQKPITSFTSAQNPHGGQESTILALNNVFYHWVCVIVAPGYSDPFVSAAGGNPYGTSWSGNDGRPSAQVLDAARYQGRLVTSIAARLAGVGAQPSAGAA